MGGRGASSSIATGRKETTLGEKFAQSNVSRKLSELRSEDYDKYVKELEKWQIGKADKNNFFESTVANWERVEKPKREPDYISRDSKGKISSKYWYTDEGVYRESNHWGKNVATCDWFLGGYNKSSDKSIKVGSKKVGYAKFKDFQMKPMAHLIADKYVLQNFNTPNLKSVIQKYYKK